MTHMNPYPSKTIFINQVLEDLRILVGVLSKGPSARSPLEGVVLLCFYPCKIRLDSIGKAI